MTPPDKVNVKTSVNTDVTKDTTAVNVESTKTRADTVVTPVAGRQSYSARFEWLPDYSQEYIITWHAGVGSVSPSFTLSNGWNLTGFASVVDSKAAENLTAVASLATAAAGALTASANFSGAGLYRMEVSSSGSLSLGALVLPLE